MPVFASAPAMLRRIFGRQPKPTLREPPFSILARSVPLDDFRIVLDVGANIGKMTRRCLEHFPNARIWSFEPVSETCEVLRRRFADEPRVQVRQQALGSDQSTASIEAAGTSVGNMIVGREEPGGRYERVPVTTGDAFLAETGLPAVDFLKIDTEGHDLKVLIGFTAALRRGAIRFLQVEASMNSTNVRHVPIQDFMGFLEPLGYHLYRVTGQVLEYDGRGILRRADLIFWRGLPRHFTDDDAVIPLSGV
ncbi:MAG TPA: FkbM family methyltransferase [Dongiaceae bacterium]|nr:FkbM family methyltransferase [Dongiaceae bacterium]